MLKNRTRFTAGLLGMAAALAFMPAIALPALAEGDPLAELRDAFAEAGAAGGDSTAINILSRVLSEVDRDGNGISQADIDLVTAVRAAQMRSQFVAARLRNDLDGDFAVTRQELEKMFSFEFMRGNRITQTDDPTTKRWRQQLEKRIDQAMADDADGNGKLEGAELAVPDKMRNGENRRDQTVRIASIMLAADPNRDGILTEAESLSMLAQSLAATGNLTPLIQQKIIERRNLAISDAPPADCPSLQLPKGAKLMVIGALYGASLPTVSIAGQDGATYSATIEVEAGAEPINIVVVSSTAIIWQFKGHTERIAMAVATSTNRRPMDGKVAAGITGLPKDRVTFLDNPACIGRFYGGAPSSVLRTKAIVERLAGQPVDAISVTHKVESVAIPSMKREQIRGRGMTFSMQGNDGEVVTDRDKAIQVDQASEPMSGLELVKDELLRFNPGGIDVIGVADVISSVKPEKYEIMPGLAGILQLVEKGDIEVLERGSYRIVRSTRLPAGLERAHFVQFYLPKGITLSKEQLDMTCVFSEKEAAFIGGMCAR